jgi:hypothetical protein
VIKAIINNRAGGNVPLIAEFMAGKLVEKIHAAVPGQMKLRYFIKSSTNGSRKNNIPTTKHLDS